MMENGTGGWIKLHRKLIDSRVFADPVALKVWIWALLKANFSDAWVTVQAGRGGKGKVKVLVKRGSFLFGRGMAAAELGISESQVRRRIKSLQEWGNLEINATNLISIVTVRNYERYQNGNEEDRPTYCEEVTNLIDGLSSGKNDGFRNRVLENGQGGGQPNLEKSANLMAEVSGRNQRGIENSEEKSDQPKLSKSANLIGTIDIKNNNKNKNKDSFSYSSSLRNKNTQKNFRVDEQLDLPLHGSTDQGEKKTQGKNDENRPTMDQVKEIIDYLNERAHRNFRHNNKATVRLIRGRWAEGYRIEDFKRVIDNKVEKWLNTDREDFLRPDTLFRPSKFESYLNERSKDEWNKRNLDDPIERRIRKIMGLRYVQRYKSASAPEDPAAAAGVSGVEGGDQGGRGHGRDEQD
jgi:uncharacterized phage protein (TIGR02220 family)